MILAGQLPGQSARISYRARMVYNPAALVVRTPMMQKSTLREASDSKIVEHPAQAGQPRGDKTFDRVKMEQQIKSLATDYAYEFTAYLDGPRVVKEEKDRSGRRSVTGIDTTGTDTLRLKAMEYTYDVRMTDDTANILGYTCHRIEISETIYIRASGRQETEHHEVWATDEIRPALPLYAMLGFYEKILPRYTPLRMADSMTLIEAYDAGD